MRVLVADDDRQMSLLVCQMLMAAGHQAFPAYDGASTMMAAVRQPSPDLIILDLQMPAGDGQTTLTKLKQSAKTALIPVIILSASTTPGVRETVRSLGAVAFLQKPIDPDTLVDAVEAFGRNK